MSKDFLDTYTTIKTYFALHEVDVNSLINALEKARNALADLGYSDDMSYELLRNKAKREYRELKTEVDRLTKKLSRTQHLIKVL